jgi:hypothetical protein
MKFIFSGPNGAVINEAGCYPRGAGFNSRVMLEFFPLVKEVEDIGLTNQTYKRSKKFLIISKEAELT